MSSIPSRQAMRRMPAATDEVRVELIPALADSGGSSSSSFSALGRRARRITYPAYQVVRALFYLAPAIPVVDIEDAMPAGAEEALELARRGRIRGMVVGTINSYLRACGRIPMVSPERPLDLNDSPLDLNATPPDLNDSPLDLNASPLDLNVSPPAPAERGGGAAYPVICADCHRSFCFSKYQVCFVCNPPGVAYLDPPVPVTADVVMPAAVEPLLRSSGGGGRALPGGPVPALLLVCNSQRHFTVTMGMLRQQPHGAPPLVWERPSSLGVLPTVVGGAGDGRLQQQRGNGGASSGAGGLRWCFVLGLGDAREGGEEDKDMLQLHDPLRLTLG